MLIYLQELLKKMNISVNQLHKMTGISRTTLDPLSKTNVVPDKTRFDTLKRIAESLEIPLSELISFENKTMKLKDFKLEYVEKNDKNSFTIILNNFQKYSLECNVYSLESLSEITNKIECSLFMNVYNYEGITTNDIYKILTKENYNDFSLFCEYVLNSLDWNINSSMISFEFIAPISDTLSVFSTKNGMYNLEKNIISLPRMNQDGSIILKRL